jgi:hypothetical protein
MAAPYFPRHLLPGQEFGSGQFVHFALGSACGEELRGDRSDVEGSIMLTLPFPVASVSTPSSLMPNQLNRNSVSVMKRAGRKMVHATLSSRSLRPLAPCQSQTGGPKRQDLPSFPRERDKRPVDKNLARFVWSE